MPQSPKFHLFADESGQNSRGVLFLVCAVVLPKDDLDAVRERLIELEQVSGRATKWAKSSVQSKQAYLDAVPAAMGEGCRVFWRSCGTGVAYAEWTCSVITEAAARISEGQLWITVDGLPESELKTLRKSLRVRKISCRKLRGARDESDPLLRLADALVGFLSDRQKRKPYTTPCWEWLAELFTAV